MKVIITVIGIFLAIIILSIFVLICLGDDVEEIDNTDGHIICGNTGQPCIKDTLYTKCNNCSGCSYENSN